MAAQKPIVRFAPSPTGPFHVGGARSALFNYLFAKKTGGQFILRIEDTDKERSKKEYEQEIYDSFSWLGLSFDTTARQSDRTDVYKKYLQKLVDSGVAFVSKETIEKESDATRGGKPQRTLTTSNRASRAEVIRFKNPNVKISFTDLIKGPITFDTTELGDFVIAKSMEEPLFHLAVVVDDFEMGITHIIRGEDHISNTPRQILIQEAIGAPRPHYAHIPLILASDRSKLSKRKHGASVSVSYYKEQGYVPKALVNFLALLGWNPGTPKELFSLPELIESFDLTKVQKSGAVFDVAKLDWMNKEYMKKDRKTAESLIAKKIKEIVSFDETPETMSILEKVIPIVFERINKLGDIAPMAEAGDLEHFWKKPSYAKDLLLWKDEKDAVKTADRLASVSKLLDEISESTWTAESIKSAVWDFATKEGRGSVLWPVRVSLSGKEKSADPFTLGYVLGKKTTLARIQSAIEVLRT